MANEIKETTTQNPTPISNGFTRYDNRALANAEKYRTKLSENLINNLGGDDTKYANLFEKKLDTLFAGYGNDSYKELIPTPLDSSSSNHRTQLNWNEILYLLQSKTTLNEFYSSLKNSKPSLEVQNIENSNDSVDNLENEINNTKKETISKTNTKNNSKQDAAVYALLLSPQGYNKMRLEKEGKSHFWKNIGSGALKGINPITAYTLSAEKTDNATYILSQAAQNKGFDFKTQQDFNEAHEILRLGGSDNGKSKYSNTIDPEAIEAAARIMNLSTGSLRVKSAVRGSLHNILYENGVTFSPIDIKEKSEHRLGPITYFKGGNNGIETTIKNLKSLAPDEIRSLLFDGAVIALGPIHLAYRQGFGIIAGAAGSVVSEVAGEQIGKYTKPIAVAIRSPVVGGAMVTATALSDISKYASGKNQKGLQLTADVLSLGATGFATYSSADGAIKTDFAEWTNLLHSIGIDIGSINHSSEKSSNSGRSNRPATITNKDTSNHSSELPNNQQPDSNSTNNSSNNSAATNPKSNYDSNQQQNPQSTTPIQTTTQSTSSSQTVTHDLEYALSHRIHHDNGTPCPDFNELKLGISYDEEGNYYIDVSKLDFNSKTDSLLVKSGASFEDIHAVLTDSTGKIIHDYKINENGRSTEPLDSMFIKKLDNGRITFNIDNVAHAEALYLDEKSYANIIATANGGDVYKPCPEVKPTGQQDNPIADDKPKIDPENKYTPCEKELPDSNNISVKYKNAEGKWVDVSFAQKVFSGENNGKDNYYYAELAKDKIDSLTVSLKNHERFEEYSLGQSSNGEKYQPDSIKVEKYDSLDELHSNVFNKEEFSKLNFLNLKFEGKDTNYDPKSDCFKDTDYVSLLFSESPKGSAGDSTHVETKPFIQFDNVDKPTVEIGAGAKHYQFNFDNFVTKGHPHTLTEGTHPYVEGTVNIQGIGPGVVSIHGDYAQSHDMPMDLTSTPTKMNLGNMILKEWNASVGYEAKAHFRGGETIEGNIQGNYGKTHFDQNSVIPGIGVTDDFTKAGILGNLKLDAGRVVFGAGAGYENLTDHQVVNSSQPSEVVTDMNAHRSYVSGEVLGKIGNHFKIGPVVQHEVMTHNPFLSATQGFKSTFNQFGGKTEIDLGNYTLNASVKSTFNEAHPYNRTDAEVSLGAKESINLGVKVKPSVFFGLSDQKVDLPTQTLRESIIKAGVKLGF